MELRFDAQAPAGREANRVLRRAAIATGARSADTGSRISAEKQTRNRLEADVDDDRYLWREHVGHRKAACGGAERDGDTGADRDLESCAFAGCGVCRRFRPGLRV